jgi:hypothetical protein
MKPTDKAEGLTGMLLSFRKLVAGKKKITFIGCPGWCTPFASLLTFVLRGTGKECVFIPNLRKDMAAKIEMTEYGMLPGEYADPASDTVVLLGGIAMPKMGIDVNEMKTLIDEITEGYPDRLILGFCIGGIFQNAGWDKLVDFDYIVDADMDVTVYGFN